MIFSTMCSTTHVDPRYPRLKWNKASLNPCFFLDSIRPYFVKYRRDNPSYPKTWEEVLTLWPNDRGPFDYRSYVKLSKNSITYSYNSKVYTYIIQQSDQSDFLIYSNNSKNEQNWCINKNYTWRWFENKDDEEQAIDYCRDKLNSFIINSFIPTKWKNSYRRTVISDLTTFRSKKASQLIIDTIFDPKESLEFKSLTIYEINRIIDLDHEMAKRILEKEKNIVYAYSKNHSLTIDQKKYVDIIISALDQMLKNFDNSEH